MRVWISLGYVIFHLKITTKAKLGVAAVPIMPMLAVVRVRMGHTGRSPELTDQLL